MTIEHLEMLRVCLLEETADQLTPVQRTPKDERTEEQIDDAIGVLEQQLATGRIALLLRLTPLMIKEMAPIERRLLHQFGTRHVSEIDRAVALLARSIGPELEVPQCLRSA